MDTDSLYLTLREKEQKDCIRPEMNAEWERLRSKDCNDSFTADAPEFSSRKDAVTSTEKTTSENTGFSK